MLDYLVLGACDLVFLTCYLLMQIFFFTHFEDIYTQISALNLSDKNIFDRDHN
jgi:hypothetical protein